MLCGALAGHNAPRGAYAIHCEGHWHHGFPRRSSLLVNSFLSLLAVGNVGKTSSPSIAMDGGDRTPSATAYSMSSITFTSRQVALSWPNASTTACNASLACAHLRHPGVENTSTFMLMLTDPSTFALRHGH